MVNCNLSMNTRKYGLIAAGVGASISAINLARGFYLRRTQERFQNYPARQIVGDSVKRGILFGGFWPVTAFMGFTEFINGMVMIGLRPSGDMFTPIDVYNMYYHNSKPEVDKYDNVQDNNETSENAETESTETENTSEPEVVDSVTESSETQSN